MCVCARGAHTTSDVYLRGVPLDKLEREGAALCHAGKELQHHVVQSSASARGHVDAGVRCMPDSQAPDGGWQGRV